MQRMLAVKKHIHDDSTRPDIDRFSVSKITQNLGGHIEHCSTFRSSSLWIVKVELSA